ncbi:DNA-binding response regulator [Tissierella sp. P1]|jgi:DNA-binding NarL/FixJ family response regulator|uniref:response regulator transcription factor n=1 Tax=Tissierella TaxID=41273 RepID=UPI000B9FA376|nr:response regulator transcription factor [Tissierella sp. P1]MDU5080681.1 response regulator transcription factor [Bacillota bacterium]OZV10917.1 DNA-binding response regulator [Tissierella sp. P1]
MDKIRIAIIDDEKLIREGLKIILSSYSDIDVIAMGESGYDALELCTLNEIDLVLMDIRMPMCDGVLGTQLIKDKFPNTKVLILTTFKDIEYIQEALKKGASGYLLKDSSYDLIYEGIKAAAMGNIVIHPDVATNILNLTPMETDLNEICERYDLNHKELDIIKYIADGLSNKEIGEKLFLSEGTIKNNVSTILSKLELRDRTQIVVFAFKNNLTK